MLIKTVTITTSPKDDHQDPYVSEIIHHDRNGKEIAHYQYNGPGEFESKIENKYNSNGDLEEETTYQDDVEVAERKSYTRNEDGKVTRIDIAFNDGSQSIRTLEYDPVKRSENWIERDEDGEQESREYLVYNAEGNLLLREVYDYRDKLLEAYEYDYNDARQVIKRRQLDNRSKLILETEFTYTPTGLLELRATRNRKGQLSEFIKIEYDENGRVFRQNLSNKYFFEFQYDQHGNTIVEERYAGDELENRITYEYDTENRVVLEEHPDLIKEFRYEFYEDVS